jgi:hypothetical protein
MPKFFFSVRRRGVVIPDLEGDELPDLEAARALAQSIIDDDRRLPEVYGEPREWQKDEFVISNDVDAIVLVIPLGGAA